MKRVAIAGGSVVLGVIIVGYVVISFQMASAVTTAERKPVETSPASHGLEFEDIEFPPRGGDLRLGGWFISGDG